MNEPDQKQQLIALIERWEAQAESDRQTGNNTKDHLVKQYFRGKAQGYQTAANDLRAALGDNEQD